MGSVQFKNQLNSAPLLAKPLASGDKFGRDYVGNRGKQTPNRLSWRMTTNNVLTDVIAEFGRKYLWWEPVSGQPHSEDRIIAQTMNLGTYDDILLLEEAVGKARLLDVMLRAEPGWINDRSWEFWRGRLSFATGALIPKKGFMPRHLEPKFSILPAAQREIWAGLGSSLPLTAARQWRNGVSGPITQPAASSESARSSRADRYG